MREVWTYYGEDTCAPMGTSSLSERSRSGSDVQRKGRNARDRTATFGGPTLPVTPKCTHGRVVARWPAVGTSEPPVAAVASADAPLAPPADAARPARPSTAPRTTKTEPPFTSHTISFHCLPCIPHPALSCCRVTRYRAVAARRLAFAVRGRVRAAAQGANRDGVACAGRRIIVVLVGGPGGLGWRVVARVCHPRK